MTYYPPYGAYSGVWKGVLVAVFSLSGCRYLGDGGTDRREILHDGTYWSWAGFLTYSVR